MKEIYPTEYVDWDAEIPVIQYSALKYTGCVRHGFSTRLGGVSQGGYSSMNLSYTRGDKKQNIDENFRRFCNVLDIEWKKIVSTDQTHTANVRVVTAKDMGCGIIKSKNCHDIDGQITNVPGVPLITYHADCVPLFFVDPVKKAIGLSHSGWKGTVQRIGEKTVKAMQKYYSCDPADIICVIGPSVCKSCYEVSQDVADAFTDVFSETDRILYPKKNGKYQLDLWEANRRIMIEAGIVPEHITVTNLCTCCHPDLLWSHRRQGSERGSLAAFLCLK